MRSHWIHRAFDVLTELFDRVGLHTNVGKIAIMACQHCCAIGGQSAEAYGLRITGEGISYQDRFHLWVLSPECDSDLEAVSLENHCQVQHGMIRGYLGENPIPPPPPNPPYVPRIYLISFPQAARDIAFPVGRFPGQATSYSAL